MAKGQKKRPPSVPRTEPQVEELAAPSLAPTGGRVKVFISWSGERGKALAHALRKWLPLVLHFADPWMSERDIDAGIRWADAVAGELEASNFGIICVTHESTAAPWLIFEAGALAKSLEDARVIPLLLELDFKEVTGPLTQFQAKKVEKTGVLEVVRSVNAVAPHAIEESRLEQLFEALWPSLADQISKIPAKRAPSKQIRSESEILDELVSTVRSLDSRMSESSQEKPSERRNQQKRLYEAFATIDALSLGRKKRRLVRDPLPLLILGSFYADDMPWIYELALSVYRGAQSPSFYPRQSARGALVDLKHALRMQRNFRIPLSGGIERDLHERMRAEVEYFLANLPAKDHVPTAGVTVDGAKSATVDERAPDSEDREPVL